MALCIVFGFLGTVLETIVVSLQKRKFVYKGAKYLFLLPVKPIYATGGLILYLVVKFYSSWGWYFVIPFAGVLVTLWELIGGWFCVGVLRDRLWNYKNKGWNIGGHISWWSTKWWLVIISIYYFFIHQKAILLEECLNKVIKLSSFQESVIWMLILLLILAGLLNIKVIKKAAKQ